MKIQTSNAVAAMVRGELPALRAAETMTLSEHPTAAEANTAISALTAPEQPQQPFSLTLALGHEALSDPGTLHFLAALGKASEQQARELAKPDGITVAVRTVGGGVIGGGLGVGAGVAISVLKSIGHGSGNPFLGSLALALGLVGASIGAGVGSGMIGGVEGGFGGITLKTR